MPRYTIHLATYASTVAEFETDLTDPAEIEAAFWETNPDMPTICAHCSGWRSEDPNLELGDEWNVVNDPDGTPLISRLDELAESD